MLFDLNNFNNLFSYLQKVPVARLLDQEPAFLIDDDGEEIIIHHQQWTHIEFNNPKNELVKLRQNFEKEFNHNKHITIFNSNSFCDEVIHRLIDLKKMFTSINLNGLAIKIRTDFNVKYLDYIEHDFMGNPNGVPFARPEESILGVDQYETIPVKFLNEISEYFTFQEEFIKDLLKDFNSYYNKNENKRKYDPSYRDLYFKFDISKIGNSDEPYKSINDFFKGLIDKKYVEEENLKNLQKCFSNIRSLQNIRWLKSKQELYYLIKRLIEQGYIVNPKRETSRIIARIFINKDGSAFLPEDFHSLHDPKNTSALDDIIGNLS